MDHLWKVGNLYIYPSHQEMIDLTFTILNLEYSICCENLEHENSYMDELEHLCNLTFKESEG